MKIYKIKTFTLIELIIVIAIIGILASILLPSLQGARLAAQSAACKSNMSQIYKGQMMYGRENRGRMYATSWGSRWLTATKTNQGWPTGKVFHDGQTGYLEPYLGDDDALVYRCPATDYDESSFFYTWNGRYGGHRGKSYEGFMNINVADPETIENTYAALDDSNSQEKFFLDASRKPFFWDYTAEVGGTSGIFWIGKSKIHGNTGKLNLAVTDGTVVPVRLQTQYWWEQVIYYQPWLEALENAIGEDGI